MANVCVIFTADALCGSHACEHNFKLFVAQFQRFLVSAETLNRRSPLAAIISLKSLTSSEHNKSSIVIMAKIPEHEGQEILQARISTPNPLSTESDSGAL
jgi:hypothetical protein